MSYPTLENGVTTLLVQVMCRCDHRRDGPCRHSRYTSRRTTETATSASASASASSWRARRRAAASVSAFNNPSRFKSKRRYPRPRVPKNTELESPRGPNTAARARGGGREHGWQRHHPSSHSRAAVDHGHAGLPPSPSDPKLSAFPSLSELPQRCSRLALPPPPPLLPCCWTCLTLWRLNVKIMTLLKIRTQAPCFTHKKYYWRCGNY